MSAFDFTARALALRAAENIVSAKDFGAVGDDATNDTAAFQAAVDALLAGTIGAIYIPKGTYRISSAISFPDNIMTGLHIYGESRTGSVIKQMTDNTPIFSFGEIDVMHSCRFQNFMMTWANPQTGNTSATCFRFLPKATSNRSIYASNFHDLFITNCYTFMRGETALFWGNSVRDVFCDTDGGFVNLYGTAGQPKVGWDNIYILGGAAGEVLFRVGAMTADYLVEVNATSALMLYDVAGGTHNIRHWALETASYGANGTLFNCVNSIVNVYGSMYLNTVTLTGTAAVIGFKTNPASPPGNGYLNIADLNIGSNLALAAGAKFTVYGGGINLSTISRIRAPWTAPNATPVCQLTDVPSADAAESLVVEEWIDPARTTIASDANVTVDYDDPATIIFGTVLTANRTVTLPRHNGVPGNNLFRGPRFKVVKLPNAGTTYNITILDYSGATVATISAATASGTMTLRWDRASLIGAGGLGHWTAEPVSPLTGLLLTVASASGSAGFRLPHGAAPSSPVNGDLWTTTAGLFARINAATKTLAFTDSALTPSTVAATGAITTTATLGYATGAGGTVTQATNKSTAVTLDKATGEITMNAANLATATTVSFTLNCSLVTATDALNVQHQSGGTIGAYSLNIRASGAGTAQITVRNLTAGTLGEAIVLKYALFKAVNA